MAYDRQKVIDIALAEVGYLEKKSNAQLDSMTANAGTKNYTKYSRDLDAVNFYNGRKQGAAWCDVFVDWCFVQAYGKDAALALTCQPTNNANNCGAGCKYSRGYYQKKGQLHDKPEPGDQIFFYMSDMTGIAHTGLVYKVDGKKVYTVEGNTSGASGVVSNGGGVAKKSYALTYGRIAGYGRPAYGDQNVYKDAEPSGAQTGANETAKTVNIELVTLRKGSTGNQVKTVQRILNDLGYNAGTVDGDFGSKTEAAVKKFQKAKGLDVDGVVGRNTWSALLK